MKVINYLYTPLEDSERIDDICNRRSHDPYLFKRSMILLDVIIPADSDSVTLLSPGDYTYPDKNPTLPVKKFSLISQLIRYSSFHFGHDRFTTDWWGKRFEYRGNIYFARCITYHMAFQKYFDFLISELDDRIKTTYFNQYDEPLYIDYMRMLPWIAPTVDESKMTEFLDIINDNNKHIECKEEVDLIDISPK